MPQIHANIQSDDYHRPSGLLSRSLQTFNKKKLLLIQLSFIITWFESSIVLHSKITFLHLWHYIFLVFHLLTILYLIFKRKSFIKFIEYFDEEIGNYAKNDDLRKFITKNRRFISMIYPVYFIIFLAYGIYDSCRSYHESQSYHQIALKAIWNLLKSVIYLNRFLVLQLIMESCLHVQICFKMVLDQVECLKKVDGSLRMEQIQMIRHIYDIAIKKTKKLDSLLCCVLAAYYLGFSGSNEAHFSAIIYNYDHLNLILIIRDNLTLIAITFYVANINRLANATFNPVYSLSYKVESQEMLNEIRYFLIRIRRNDVGLTILKIVTVTPAFVSSIATILLTIALKILSIK